MTARLPEFDPILVEAVERALAPYAGKLPAEVLAHFRAEALVLLSTHPYPVALLQQLRPPPEIDRSTDVQKQGWARKEGAQQRGRRRGGS